MTNSVRRHIAILDKHSNWQDSLPGPLIKSKIWLLTANH